MSQELGNLTIKETAKLLAAREVSACELAEAYLARAEAENPALNAYLQLTGDLARAEAKRADAQRAAGDATTLTGVPLAVKDNFLVRGTRATAASRILASYESAYDGTAIARLRAQGVVVLGKTNLDEFAMGASTENSAYGPTKNPCDPTRVPGGSSGGSAAAVAANLAVAALGTDTGGSIRQPAGFCGVVGLKPTYGRVSRHGIIAMTSSFDQIGPITKTAWDAAALLEGMAGIDPMDATTSPEPVPSYTASLTGDVKGLRIGIAPEFFAKGIDSDVEASVRSAIAALEDLGAVTVPVSLPRVPYALAVYYVIVPSEVSSNLARFDGIRYGYSAASDPNEVPDGLLEVYRATRGIGFGPEVKRRIIVGTYALSAGYYDAYYKKAQQVRTLLADDFKTAFASCDVIVSPTSPTPAFKLGEVADPVQMYLADVFTAPVNVAGICGISVPCGTVMREGAELPVGLQFMGPNFGETTILRAADAFERTRG